MIQKIRDSRVSKVVAVYLSLQMFLSVVQPNSLWASTSGPSQPEFNSFTPIGTSDMVNLSTGDFNYNIPIMDVGGYPINLAYDSGITMDQEASWVGLGWNLNVGQINRQVRGIPDDFNGDEIVYEDHIKDNKTVGVTLNINVSAIGIGDAGLGASTGVTIQHNNYEGISFKPSYGVSFDITQHMSAGMQLTSSATDGVSFSPNLSISSRGSALNNTANYGLGANIGLGYNSRQGLSSFSLGSSYSLSKLSGKQTNSLRSNSNSSISFVNQTFTPFSRAPYYHSNASFAFSLGGDVWGIDAEIGLTGFSSLQRLYDITDTQSGLPGIQRSIPAFGYNHTQKANEFSILDFNNEKEDIVSKNTLVLPVTNYTYDLFQVNGQGMNMMFRPFRSQVGYLSHNRVIDQSSSENLGGEYQFGAGAHIGFDFNTMTGTTETGVWDTQVLEFFKKDLENTDPLPYEEFYYKAVGEYTVDPEGTIFNDDLGGNQPVRIGLGGTPFSFGKYAKNEFEKKKSFELPPSTTPPNSDDYELIPINDRIKRTQRELRNKAVIPVTQEEARYDTLFNYEENRPFSQPHHIAGFKVINTDGSRYVYGENVYNSLKEEITFATNQKTQALTSNYLEQGTAPYILNQATRNNDSGQDHYFNKVVTPPYAHTYLLTSVLSADYEDVDFNGPSINDVGSYTLFNYQLYDDEFAWKTPHGNNIASFNEGLNTRDNDQKSTIIRGVKELKYLNTIETKTHVAYFQLSNRSDGVGSDDSHQQKIDKIYLFSKPEIDKLMEDAGVTNISQLTSNILNENAIKIAHFVYDRDGNGTDDYDLCPGVPNSSNGKLTLHELYFTYRKSNMGKYNPYKFYYNTTLNSEDSNFPYQAKAQDIWGNYKPHNGSNLLLGIEPNPQEFPFVDQEDRELQDFYAQAWTLTSIDLPSGGTIDINYESDDYQYVQDKRAMQMFKVVGVTKDDEIPSLADIGNDLLYTPGNNYDEEGRYLIIETRESNSNGVITKDEFIDRYLGDYADKPIYFRFLMNMTKEGGTTSAPPANDRGFEYVTGYFEIEDLDGIEIFEDASQEVIYAAIPMKFTDVEGGVASSTQVNPISKAGWYFGRKNLQRDMFGLPAYSEFSSITDVTEELVASLEALSELFQGPNKKLRNERLIARRFEPQKSWIRLQEPTKTKLGGGVRVTSIKMFDNWDDMLDTDSFDHGQSYGQEYTYQLEDGTSSGVATYEPNMSKENPFVEPFYHKGENLVAPRELNYAEKPFGESFFPSAKVTYSRVTVQNLSREREISPGVMQRLKRHATGKVINHFYTSKDFPTLVDFTSMNGPENWASNESNVIPNALGGLLGLEIDVKTELTLSQGFSVQTNDMDGKQKRQEVFNEQGQFISGVDYNYQVDENGNLDNFVNTINSNGVLTPQEVGMQYDVYNFFNKNYTQTKTAGVQGNLTIFPPSPFPWLLPVGVPNFAKHTNTLQTVTTTKVIHRSGILKEKIAYDLGAMVSTKNLAWDATTGEVLLTETDNEYNEGYFNFNYPAHWYYKGMGLATQNVGISGIMTKDEEVFAYDFIDAEEIFFPGDELLVEHLDVSGSNYDEGFVEKLWVTKVNGRLIQLMDGNGEVVNYACEPDAMKFTIVRSGYRNQAMASMASVTSMVNPFESATQIDSTTYHYLKGEGVNPRIINASAVQYSDAWTGQNESNLPPFPNNLISQLQSMDYSAPDPIDGRSYGFNPYKYNVRGDWRALRSHAYLTGRNNSQEDNGEALRRKGFFNEFNPYYKKEGTAASWQINNFQWTFASEITQFSPYGTELENKDALGRYSAAQYGYNYTLPVAVASNSSYAEIGFDGFEDYDYQGANGENYNPHFGLASINPNVSLTEIEDNIAHTGRRSIKIEPNSEETLLSRDYTNQCDNNIPIEDPDCTTPPTCNYFPSELAVTDPEGTIWTVNGTCVEGIVEYRIPNYENYDAHLCEPIDANSCFGNPPNYDVKFSNPDDTPNELVITVKVYCVDGLDCGASDSQFSITVYYEIDGAPNTNCNGDNPSPCSITLSYQDL